MTDKLLQLTKELMLIRSTKDHPEELIHILEVAKREINGDFTVEEFESNDSKSILVHNREKGTRQFKIVLNAHFDVVHGTKKEFIPYEKDGKLYGRGGYDMKAAAAAMMLVFKAVADKVSYPLALQLVTDEEIGGFNGTHYQIQQGVRADFVITGECGSNLDIVNEAKGIFWLKLHTRGTKAHGAYLWRGENALWKLHHALAALHKLFPVPDSAAWVTTMNLAKIETENNAFNHVPDGATAYLDIRFVPDDEEHLLTKITQALSPDVEIETMFCDSPEYVAPDNKYVKLLQQHTTEQRGEGTKLISAHAPSDIRHYNSANCLGITFGTKGAHQHADEEWVDIKSIEDYYNILERFLLSVKD